MWCKKIFKIRRRLIIKSVKYKPQNLNVAYSMLSYELHIGPLARP